MRLEDRQLLATLFSNINFTGPISVLERTNEQLGIDGPGNSGNIRCGDLGLVEVTSGVNVTNQSNTDFDFTSQTPLVAVLVKGSNATNVFQSNPAGGFFSSGRDLDTVERPGKSQPGISHITFCTTSTPPPVPGTVRFVKATVGAADAGTTFAFTGTGTAGVVGNFTLAPGGTSATFTVGRPDGRGDRDGQRQLLDGVRLHQRRQRHRDGIAPFNLAAGANVTCTFTNTAAGQHHDRQRNAVPRRPARTSPSTRPAAGLPNPFVLDDDPADPDQPVQPDLRRPAAGHAHRHRGRARQLVD